MTPVPNINPFMKQMTLSTAKGAIKMMAFNHGREEHSRGKDFDPKKYVTQDLQKAYEAGWEHGDKKS